MAVFPAILLGILQGITEFLPISSTGHLLLAHAIFGASGTDLAFDAVLQLATALAVVVYFWSDLMILLNTAIRKLSRLPVNERDLTLIYALLIGTIPGVVFGLMLESLMESVFREPLLVAGVLVAGSVLFAYAEWRYLNSKREGSMSVKKGLIIGLFQALALVPGMSRSGASIAGGMLLGLSRSEAARFSFLLAVPIILGSGMKKLLDLLSGDASFSWPSLLIGSIVAFVVGLVAIHLMLSFVRSHTLWPFIWYRIILAGFVVFVVYFG